MRTIVEIAKDYEARRELVPVPAPLLLKPPNSARIAPHMQSSILPVPQMHLIPGRKSIFF